MVNDELDQLSDRDLDLVFEREVAGIASLRGHQGHARSVIARRHGETNYCADANNVLPWLEKCHEVSNVFEKGAWFVGIERSETHDRSFVSASGKCFARTVALALIRGARAAKMI